MHLLHTIEKYLRKNEIPAARFGRDAVGDPRFVFDLRNGREPRQGTCLRVLAYLDARAASKRDA